MKICTNSKIFTSLSICMICLSITLSAQEQNGLRTENYSGTNSLLLNPANEANSPLNWNLHLFSIGVFVQNNYAYIQNTSGIGLIKNGGDLSFVGDEEATANDSELYFDFFDVNRKMYVNTNAIVSGPGISFKAGKKLSFGLFTHARTMIGSHRIPYALAYYEFDRQLLNESFQVKPVQASGMTWGEIGVNAGYRFAEHKNSYWSAGINLKYVLPYAGFYFNSKNTVELTKLPNDTLLFNGAAFDYALSTPEINNNNRPQKNGNGFSTDIGLTYTQGSNELICPGYNRTPCQRVDYKWRIGFALLDLGYVRFNKNAQKHKIDTEELFDIITNTFNNSTDETDVLTNISNEVFSDTAATFQQDYFSMWMPLALSLQVDYRLVKNLYVNTTLVRRIHLAGNQLSRGNTIAITPRYESRWLTWSIPVSLHNDRKFMVGTALRLAYLTIGSDNLLSIVKKQKQFTGSDVYLSLNINPFSINKKQKAKDYNKCFQF